MSSCDEVRLRPGELLICEEAWGLVEGRVRAAGRIVDQPGACLGLLPVLSVERAPDCVVALAPTILRRIPRPEIIRRLQASRAARHWLCQHVADTLPIQRTPGVVRRRGHLEDRGRALRLSPLGDTLWRRIETPRTVPDLAPLRLLAANLLGLGFAYAPDLAPDVPLVTHRPAPPSGVLLRPLPGLARLVDRTFQAIAPALLHPLAQLMLLIVVLLGGAALLLFAGDAIDAVRTVDPATLPFLYVVALAGILFHELGHAAALLACGRPVEEIAYGWQWFGPAAHADLTAAELCTREQRITIALAGPYVNLVLFGAIATAATLAGSDLLWLSALTNLVLAAAHLNPLLELDGHRALSALVGRPHLRRDALRSLASGGRRYRAYAAAILIGLALEIALALWLYGAVVAPWLAPLVSRAGAAWLAFGWHAGVVCIVAGSFLVELIHASRGASVLALPWTFARSSITPCTPRRSRAWPRTS